jgi:carbonic anhydrase
MAPAAKFTWIADARLSGLFQAGSGCYQDKMNTCRTDELLQNARRYNQSFTPPSLSGKPALRVAVVACMDARLDPRGLLGLRDGDAHVIRNAGGVVTPDVIRSLTISQRLLGSREIVLIHHTRCGMLAITDDEFREQLRAETGVRPDWEPGGFGSLEQSVLDSAARIAASPFISHKGSIRGFVFEVGTGRLREIQLPADRAVADKPSGACPSSAASGPTHGGGS